MTNPTTAPVPVQSPAAPPATPDQPSLVQRIATLEDQQQRIFAMMKRDREYMNELQARIGLT